MEGQKHAQTSIIDTRNVWDLPPVLQASKQQASKQAASKQAASKQAATVCSRAQVAAAQARAQAMSARIGKKKRCPPG